jgi:hypothetical protein
MTGGSDLPDLLEPIGSDAFTGTEVPAGRFGQQRARWALRGDLDVEQPHLLPSPAHPSQWRDESVGWGLVLPEREGTKPTLLATADDAPEPIRTLVAKRGGKVLRYAAAEGYARWTLRDYRDGADLLTAASPPGTGRRQLPMYLLIYGTPAEIPWELQYSLNMVRYVGRLDITGDALSNYVSALLDDWSESRTRYSAPVLWSVDHGSGDITTLMRESICAPIFAKLSEDVDICATRYIDGSTERASCGALVEALETNKPSLIITTSHGLTGPLDDLDAMRARLGMLVDGNLATASPEQLLTNWQPDGAIWFAQACCSAGASHPSAYHGLFDADSMLASVLEGVSALGAMTAPLPRALLGAPRPLRAFVGRVEPTFNWTMAYPPTRQRLTHDLQRALYDRLCTAQPVGLAMRECYEAIGALLLTRDQEVGEYNRHTGDAARSALEMVLYSTVTAQDRAATVILGDPTVAIPLPDKGRR